MERNDVKYSAYVQMLKEELIPAMGCTEPISLAYAAAVAKKALGGLPDKICVSASGSILKNVKSVIVPNTDHMKGIPAAIAAGIVAGDAEKGLEVISQATKEQIGQMREFMEYTPIEVGHMDQGNVFDLLVTVYREDSYVKIRIVDFHTNIVLVERDGQVLYEQKVEEKQEKEQERGLLSMEDIWEFTQKVDLDDVKDVLDRQISYNMAIAEQGLAGDYGANIGSTLLEVDGETLKNRAKAMAAAGSDARMNGCELPVVVNSGSGNQGMTASIPVIVYGRGLKVSDEKLYRALVLSNLVTIYQKVPIGSLSAYCGAISAGAGAGTGIAYLHGGGYEEVVHTLVNALGILPGVICDGAKASCAAKIAFAVEAGITGYHMYRNGQQFYGGDGVIAKGVEATLCNIGRLGKEGMKGTNEEIIKMMIGN